MAFLTANTIIIAVSGRARRLASSSLGELREGSLDLLVQPAFAGCGRGCAAVVHALSEVGFSGALVYRPCPYSLGRTSPSNPPQLTTSVWESTFANSAFSLSSSNPSASLLVGASALKNGRSARLVTLVPCLACRPP